MSKWCLDCEKTVTPTKKMSLLGLVLCFTVVGIIFYLLYYILLKREKCPICNGSNFADSKPILSKDSKPISPNKLPWMP